MNPLDQKVMLATAMHAQPGVYALLLGSGVSTGSGVPTGWQVVERLVRQLAAAEDPGNTEAGDQAAADPEGWWAARETGALGYSALLEKIAPTPAARQGLLAGFFEPTEEDRANEVKVPSKAHHAVAELVRRGAVRIVLTTNFDRLTEQALESAGVSPQVISRPEAVKGMAPLTHAPATVIKLHGDYKDLTTLNTPAELDAYPDQWIGLVRQVFDEYGLVISGWSADYDTALVRLLEETAGRRYPLYWDSRSSKKEKAQQLLTGRRGTILPADTADDLFTTINISLQALDRMAEPPLTTAMAVANLKRHLLDPVRRVDVHDLVMRYVDDVTAEVAEQPVYLSDVNGDTIQSILAAHREVALPLALIASQGVWHDRDGLHDQLWCDVLQRLVDAGTRRLSSWTNGLEYARLYPALLVQFALGVVAARRGREDLVIRLATTIYGRTESGMQPLPAAQLLHPQRVLTAGQVLAMPRWNGTRWNYPASRLLNVDVREMVADLISDEDDYLRSFYAFEYRLGLLHEWSQEETGECYPALQGEYIGDRGWTRNPEGTSVPISEREFEHAANVPGSPWAPIIGTTPEKVRSVLVGHSRALASYRGQR